MKSSSSNFFLWMIFWLKPSVASRHKNLWITPSESVYCITVTMTKSDGKELRQVRLNLVLDTQTMLPEQLSVSGNGQGCESLSFLKHITPGAIHVMDRNFVDFVLMDRVLEVGDLLLRARANAPGFVARCSLALGPKDIEHGVISDRIGYLSGRGAPAAEAR